MGAKKKPDPNQPTFFSAQILPEPAAPEIEPPFATVRPQLDPETLYELIEERDGVPGIRVGKFAEWSGYVQVEAFRRHIERLRAELEELGPFSQIHRMVGIGSGARREVRDYWLNPDQLNHALIRTRLPQLRALRVLVTKVFGKWQSGKLRPVDTATEVELQEATDRAIDQAPGIMELGAALARREDAIRAREAAERAEESATQAHFSARRTEKAVTDIKKGAKLKPTKEAIRTSKYIIFFRYDGWCPCCNKTKIMKTPERLEDKTAHWDHALHAHKRGPFDGWYVCIECNDRFEDPKTSYRVEKAEEWRTYIGNVKNYFKIRAPALM